MQPEPAVKRAVAFVDGQNLYHAARLRFGAVYPNYDPRLLARTICEQQGWTCSQTRFYTGVHSHHENPHWHQFWSRKLAALNRHQDVFVFKRTLSYVNEWDVSVSPPRKVRVAREKGVDVRIALDIVRCARQGAYDVAIIFSEDTDFVEVVNELRAVAHEQKRWINAACAYPYNEKSRRPGMGIPGTAWIKIDQETYAACTEHT